MVYRPHLIQVARELKKRLGKNAFIRIRRADVTQLLREISGEDTTRIKSAMSQELERALLEQGVRCFPAFSDTDGEDMVRLFHAGTVVGRIVDMVLYPGEETDKDLAEALAKFKGKWIWGAPHDDVA